MIKISKFWIRFLTVFLIHIIIKSFDLSFPNGPFALDMRSLVFSVFLLGYGLIIWYISEWFDKRLRKTIPEPENSGGKMLATIAIHIVFSWVLMASLNHFYRVGDISLFGSSEGWGTVPPFNPVLTFSLTTIYIIIVGFDNFVRIQNKLQSRELETTRLQKENITAQYRALKAQIEPHFLFNSLSVLSSLVYEDVDRSADFIVKLSRTLRYIIEKNEFNLVTLSEELEFLDAYFFLIKTRLDDGVFLDNSLDNSLVESTYIPPVTIQLLVENAIKHNTYNPDNPIKIQIRQELDYIVISNTYNPRSVLVESTKKGLKNISERYDLISEKKVEIIRTDDEFIVKIPILKQNDYERINI